MENKTCIKNFTLKEIEDLMIQNGFPKYRALQIFKWIYKDIDRFEQMGNLPKPIMDFLHRDYYINRASILEKQVSKDGTTKILFGLNDGNAVECVLMKYQHGYSLCISTQVGCRMGCEFCASTIGGLIRNLTSGEMIEEIMATSRDTGISISNIVLMGIGEPFDNYDQVIKFLKIVNDKNGLNIGMRHITISTSGVVPNIYRFADEGIQCTLAVSLHSAINNKRSEIMPINKKYNIEELIKACDYYIDKTNKRITFEYALIRGVNDSADDAEALGNLLKNMLCHINLIPVNPVKGKIFEKTEDSSIYNFKKIIEKYGINTTIRRELGSDIEGACGQLRKNRANKGFLDEMSK